MQPDNIVTLTLGDRQLTLVGTAHVSDASVEEVKRVIDATCPDVVCVELCQARYNALTSDAAWRDLDIFKVIKEGKMLFLLANLAIGAHQRRMGAELGVKPGAELIAAAEKAKEVGAEVVLIDRTIHTTLKRTWANLSFGKKMGMFAAIMDSLVSRKGAEAVDIEDLKKQANLSEILDMLAKELPEVKGPLIDERDAYMVAGIESAPGKNVVAVVGAAHLPGMTKLFGTPIDRAALDLLPKPGSFLRIVKWLIPIAIVAAFIVGINRKAGASFDEMLMAWILPNSIAAALFTAIAGGKLLSIGASIITSPITSLNPLIGTGMVIGLLEAWLRKPTVRDCEQINDDVQSLRGVYRNQVTRVLLVAVMSGLGSAVGAWIGLSWVVVLVA